MDSMDIIRGLENELVDDKGYFRKKIDARKCYDLVRLMAKQFPEGLSDADNIIANRTKILQSADTVAKNTIRAAQERAQQMVSASEIVRLADIEANRTIDRARVNSNILITKTKEHLDKLFDETERYLLSSLEMIRRNREELRVALVERK